MKRMKSIKSIMVLVLIISLCLSACGRHRFSEEDVMGLTSREIIEKFGDFDRKIHGIPDADGLYRNCACGYLIREAKVGLLGTTPPEYFMMYFNEDGIVDYCRYEEVV